MNASSLKKYIVLVFIDILSFCLNTYLIIYLFNNGLFNFGVVVDVDFVIFTKDFFIQIVTDVLFITISIYYIYRFYKNTKTFGKDYLKYRMDEWKKELIACYGIVLVITLLAIFIPIIAAYACLFVPLSLIALNPWLILYICVRLINR